MIEPARTFSSLHSLAIVTRPKDTPAMWKFVSFCAIYYLLSLGASSLVSYPICTDQGHFEPSISREQVNSACNRAIRGLDIPARLLFRANVRQAITWKPGSTSRGRGEGHSFVWPLSPESLCAVEVYPEDLNPEYEDLFPFIDIIRAATSISNQCTRGSPLRAGYARVGDKQRWLVKLKYRVVGTTIDDDGQRETNDTSSNIAKRDNRVAECMQRKNLPSYITQRQVVEDCTLLILRVIENPRMRWDIGIHTPILWRSDTGPPGAQIGRPVRWRGIRHLCEFGVRPEPPMPWGAEEDVFTVNEVIDAARAIKNRCINGRPMRNGKYLVGPKGKWAADIMFPEYWPPPDSRAADNVSMPNTDMTS